MKTTEDSPNLKQTELPFKNLTISSLCRAIYPKLYNQGLQKAKDEGQSNLCLHTAAQKHMMEQLSDAQKAELKKELTEIKSGKNVDPLVQRKY